MRNLVTIFFLVLISFAPGRGQSPALINYQAVARNSDGTPIADATFGIRVLLLQGSEHGTPLYIETQQVHSNEFGIFTMRIGEGNGTRDFSTIEWGTAGDLWLQIRMDPENSGNYITLGASQLVSVPYALYAKEAASAAPVLKILTDQERDALEAPVNGTMILNESTGNLNVFRDGQWWEVALTAIAQEWSCGKDFTDSRDGRRYKTVPIGTRCWMAENLNFGQMVNISAQHTNNGVVEKYCYDNVVTSCDTYGALYQWDEVMNYTTASGGQGICPEGWHVPTDLEWQEMEVALGMSTAEAARSNIWRGTDQGTKLGPGGSSGYNALYSGRSVPGYGYTALGGYEYVWTSDDSGDNAWRRCLSASDPKVGRYNSFPKTYGMSVRCIR